MKHIFIVVLVGISAVLSRYARAVDISHSFLPLGICVCKPVGSDFQLILYTHQYDPDKGTFVAGPTEMLASSKTLALCEKKMLTSYGSHPSCANDKPLVGDAIVIPRAPLYRLTNTSFGNVSAELTGETLPDRTHNVKVRKVYNISSSIGGYLYVVQIVGTPHPVAVRSDAIISEVSQ